MDATGEKRKDEKGTWKKARREVQAEAEVVMGSSFLVVRERGYGPTLDAIFGTKESFFILLFFCAKLGWDCNRPLEVAV